MRVRRLWVLFAVLVSGALAMPPAHAQEDDPDKALAQMEMMIRRGRFEMFVDNLEANHEKVVELLSAMPAKLRKAADIADRSSGRLVTDYAVPFDTFTGMLVESAQKALELKKDEPDALWSAGLARLFQGRLARPKNGGATDVTPWRDAAEKFRLSWEANPADGAAAVRSAQALEEASRIPGAPVAELTKAADAISEQALKKHPQSATVLAQSGLRAMQKAKDPATKRPEAKALIDEALGRLAAFVAKKDPDVEVATAWNDLVAYAIGEKMGLKHQFRTSPIRCGSELEVQVPISRKWISDTDQSEPWVHQMDDTGDIIRTFGFDRYNWDTNYHFDIGEAGGDNQKGIATQKFESTRRSMVKVETAKEPSKGRINPRIAGGFTWEVIGEKDKKRLRERAWFFKSDKGHMMTFAFYAFEWTPTEMDPQAKSLVESLTELEKGK